MIVLPERTIIKDLSGPFNRHANPYAPDFEPARWNDLAVDPKKNEEDFFNQIREKQYHVILTLQMASLLSLRNIIALVDEGQYSREYSKKSEVTNMLAKEDVESIVGLIRIYFSAMQTRANCYAYALNFQNAHPGAKPDPGMKTIEYQHRFYDTYEEAITAGAIVDGLTPAGKNMPPEKDGFYRVALFIDEKKPSFHWVREDKFGFSSKDGHGPVKNTDYKGNIIETPETASFGEYRLSGYFYVPHEGIVPLQYRVGNHGPN